MMDCHGLSENLAEAPEVSTATSPHRNGKTTAAPGTVASTSCGSHPGFVKVSTFEPSLRTSSATLMCGDGESS